MSYPVSTLSARAAAPPCAAPDSTGHEQSFTAEIHDMSSKILSSRSCLLFRAEVCSYLQIFKRRVAHSPSEQVETDGNLNTGRAALARVAFSHPDAHVHRGALAALNSGWATGLAATTSRAGIIFFLAQAEEVVMLRSQGQCYSQ